MIVDRKNENANAVNFYFDNGAWVLVDVGEGCYEYQADADDEESYLSGCLEFSDRTLVGYDGCFELPCEVVEAVMDMGYKIDL